MQSVATSSDQHRRRKYLLDPEPFSTLLLQNIMKVPDSGASKDKNGIVQKDTLRPLNCGSDLEDTRLNPDDKTQPLLSTVSNAKKIKLIEFGAVVACLSSPYPTISSTGQNNDHDHDNAD